MVKDGKPLERLVALIETALGKEGVKVETRKRLRDRTNGKLREHDWNVSETARALDMPRSNLYKKIERYSLTRETAS